MRSRNANVAMLLSAIFPGLGQFYNRQYPKGTVFFMSGLVLSWITSEMLPPLAVLLVGETPKGLGQLAIMTFLFLACYAYSIVDAYRSAKRSATG